MMQIRFSEIANDELADSCDWYERQQEGLGLRFKSAVRGDEVWVVAVSHQHRRPDYWAERIDSK
jgi:hypothetical protein